MKDFLKGVMYVGLFIIPIIPLIVTDSLFFPFITGKNFTFRIVVEIVFVAWALLAVLDERYRPRFSWLLVGFSAFMGIMLIANLLGEYPLKSFWSNFERMDGYVTLIHVYLLTIVLGSAFRDRKMWTYFIGTSVAAASYIAFDGLQQYIYKIGSWRIDSTLGNASYMAVYMYFHAFFTVWLFNQTKQWWVRGILGILFVLFVYLLILTATRGTFVGLAGGLGLTMLYLLIFARGLVRVRQIAAGALVLIVLMVSSIFIFKDNPVIADNLILERISSISLDELSVRFDIWGMAWEGVQQRPILGWGQGNFNYVFNAEYNSDLYFAEAWFDRVHNIALDWLIAGGVLGFTAYVSIFLAIVFYLFWRPLMARGDTKKEDEAFTVSERAILLGMVAGYVVHNLVVFDNIVSYIFFAVMLGLIQSRIGTDIPSVRDFKIDERIVSNVMTPVAAVCLLAVIYLVNVPGIQTSRDIIIALTAPDIQTRLEAMESAISRDSFAYQEVVEQLASQAMQIGANPRIPQADKQAFIARAEQELLELAERKPGDARVHVFISGFYRNIGAVEESKVHIDIARELSPTKQAIILEQGILAFQLQDYQAMHGYFKEAFELQHEYDLARTFLAASYLYIGQPEMVEEVITEEHFEFFANNDFAIQSVNRFQQGELLRRMFQVRIDSQPNNPQHRASLAFLLYQNGNIDEAIAILDEAVADIPAFAEIGSCYADNLRAGNQPDLDCQ